MIILKIGGSAFTDKAKGIDHLEKISKLVATEISSSGVLSRKRLILLHGAGYFLHKFAIERSITKYKKGKEVDFAEITAMGQQISSRFALDLANGSVPALTLSTRSLCRFVGDRLIVNKGVIEGYLKLGYVPLLSSDIPLATREGMKIASGDLVAATLASTFNAERVIFGTDVDGVLDSNRKPIKRLCKKDLSALKILDSNRTDFTGGMKLKLDAIKRMRCPVSVINLRKNGNLRKELAGQHVGTLIE